VDIYNQKVARSTAGSILNIPIVLDQDLGEAISMLKEAGLQVFSTAASGRSIAELDKAVVAKPTAWIFGNEAHGVSGQVALLADDSVSLPIYGSAESLNLATAASVCLYFTAVAQQTSH
jgi:TrmH family RNA methyltransferase